ncbi:MAG: SDR family NAD(P)-dependent oxidoreductase [Acidobacteria bacterium]|nr:MAG: SDR family NAD(P)-dependent oxidoreductase [Acidobacteriota bacterium]REK02710.1 MAG: SDR family NAD(P)-dependent oxidoreductase [Acidobacteriota bacterium]REK13485.1 MAG: SDR family NAD(P)-dependent oxidoreductase [Acidobacteriota bacterium]REK41479.1 MAG: SDR family NAD(P)-dependent oxidoreductase [Acidobacteriota bacterium]
MLNDRVGLVLGVANKRSIAWACAESCIGQGAKVAFTYQGERLLRNVEKVTADLEDTLLIPCDVTNQAEVDSAFESIDKKYGRLDFLIHSIAFAPREALEGEFLATTRDAFLTALEISAFSLAQVSRSAKPLMKNGGSVVTMSYYGAEKVVENYNVMGVAKSALESCTRYLANDLGRHGIRVNAISAGPLNTLSARGVKNLTGFLKHVEERSPLKRNVEAREVGDTAMFLVSDLSSGITGETIYVDCGYNIMGI